IKPKTVSRYLIPVKNGVFNLKTKQLEPFTPNYVFTSKIATAYVENPSLPKFNDWDVESWLNEIACGDAQITTLLWQVISDAINGNYSRKKSIWLMGDGSNGKGTYQQLLYNLIGPQNIATLKINQFSERFKLALLVEKVAVIGDDVGAGIYIDDSSEFNSVVTNETILIEVKNRMPYSARMYVTVIQSTNEMPKIRNKSNGTYRRLLIVPFNASFEGAKDDWRIKEEYINRKEVLEYVLHKAVNMDFERFIVPDVSKKLLEEYKQENDPLVDFRETVFKPLGINKIPFYMVYSQYKEFCKENNFKPLSKIKFSKQFTYLLGDSWINKKIKYSVNEIEKIKALGDFFSYEEPPENGMPYQSLVRNDLKLIS
ncbi:phage/plasmid primase, P4 family, partial [Enterococcus faecalis]